MKLAPVLIGTHPTETASRGFLSKKFSEWPNKTYCWKLMNMR